MQVGVRYDVPVIAPVPAHTVYFESGALSVGVEFRLLTDNLVDQAYADKDPEITARIEALRTMGFDDNGLSFHVCDARSGVEYLRFDMFEDGPHYHYLHAAEGYHEVVMYDHFASGPMFEWAIACLRSHLPDMLRYCRQDDLAGRVTQGDVDELVPQILDAAATARRLTVAGS
jgi:hypothetical protein